MELYAIAESSMILQVFNRLNVIAVSFSGYTAPEYAIRGELSVKADIYSFGVLVLEIISCRKNTDLTLPPEMQYLPEYVCFRTFVSLIYYNLSLNWKCKD